VVQNYNKITPTCFGILTPSSGSLQVLLAKVMNYCNDNVMHGFILYLEFWNL